MIRLLHVILFCGVILAQEMPFFTVQKFDRSYMHRQNLCERQRLLFEGNVSLENALGGLDLNVVMTDYTGTEDDFFFSLNERGEIRAEDPGIFVVLLDEIARRAGFRWRDSFGLVKALNSEEDGNKTWADLLEWEVETFDLSVEGWARSVDRMARSISFTGEE